MRKRARNRVLSFRLNPDDEDMLEKIYELSGTKQPLSTFIRDILLGNIEHPRASLNRALILDVKDYGPLEGSYDFVVFYRSFVIAAKYLKINLDSEYAKIIKANKPAYDKILRQIRGYEFDEEMALKRPLKSPR